MTKDRKYVEHMMRLYGVSNNELASWRGVSIQQMEEDLDEADNDPDWAEWMVDMAWNYSAACTNGFGIW